MTQSNLFPEESEFAYKKSPASKVTVDCGVGRISILDSLSTTRLLAKNGL